VRRPPAPRPRPVPAPGRAGSGGGPAGAAAHRPQGPRGRRPGQARRRPQADGAGAARLPRHLRRDAPGVDGSRLSAAAGLLPFVEEGEPHKQIDFKGSVDGGPNAVARKAAVRASLSPRDPPRAVRPGRGATNHLFNDKPFPLNSRVSTPPAAPRWHQQHRRGRRGAHGWRRHEGGGGPAAARAAGQGRAEEPPGRRRGAGLQGQQARRRRGSVRFGERRRRPALAASCTRCGGGPQGVARPVRLPRLPAVHWSYRPPPRRPGDCHVPSPPSRPRRATASPSRASGEPEAGGGLRCG
jgi:hypothetical protein